MLKVLMFLFVFWFACSDCAAQDRRVDEARDCFLEQRGVSLVMIGQKREARRQTPTLFAGMQKSAIKRGQPTPGALQRFMEGRALNESLDDDRQRPSEGSSGR